MYRIYCGWRKFYIEKKIVLINHINIVYKTIIYLIAEESNNVFILKQLLFANLSNACFCLIL